MLSAVIQALKKSVMFLCKPFAKRCFIYSDWVFETTLHSSSARQDLPCADSPDRDSGPDYRSVRNKEVKFIWIYSLGPRFSVPLSVLERVRIIEGFFSRKYEGILWGLWKLSVIERCPYREVRTGQDLIGKSIWHFNNLINGVSKGTSCNGPKKRLWNLGVAKLKSSSLNHSAILPPCSKCFFFF